MSNVNEPNRFKFDALNAKEVYGICTPKNKNDSQFYSALNAKEVYGIRTPKEDVVDIKTQKQEKLPLSARLRNFISGLFKKDK